MKELYTKPKGEEILGSYLHTETTGVGLPIPFPRNAPVSKRRKKSFDVKMKDRIFFNRNQTQRSNQNHPSSKDVVTEKFLILD